MGRHNEHLGSSPYIQNEGSPILPSPANVNHAGLSVSSWYKKAIVPLFIDGVIVNFIESLQQLSQSLKTIKVISPLSSATYCDVIFDCKALNPGTEVYQDKLYGVMPPIDVEEAKTLCENGYKTMLQSLIDEICKKRRFWVKQAEVYMLQFLDIKVAVPIEAFFLSEEGTSDDVDVRVKLVLQYITACGGCLKEAKNSGEPPICTWYCQACMRYRRVCNVHEDLYTEWLCDARPCEQCLRRENKCIRFSVLLCISDQAPCYEKYGRSVSSCLQDILDGQGKSEFPMRHIHDVGHHLKNAQASLERGTHFDGSYTYDSKDLWVAASTSEEEQVETLFKGLSQRALFQIDKHGEELALQRVSDQVILTVDSICSFVKTDIPELYKLWTSTSSNHSSLIGTPLFICISKRGVVFYSDDNKPGIFFYRQTPIKRKIYTISCGCLADEENDPVAHSEIKAKEARWKSIGGLALMNTFNPEKQSTKLDDLLLVADTSLQTIRCIPKVSCLRKSPRETFSVYKLQIFDNDESQDDFFPFAVRSGLPNDNQFIVTNPVMAKIYLMQLSPGYKEAAVLRVITQQGIYRTLDCVYWNGKYYCTDNDSYNNLKN